MIRKGRVFFGAVATLVILGVGCFVESKHSMGSTMKTQSSLVAQLTSELKMAQSQDPCPRGPSVAPAKETRKIREDKFQFSFNIPTNYRNEKRQYNNSLSIFVYNPADTKLLECCRINRILFDCGYGTLPVWVRVEPATPETRLIPEPDATTLRVENIRETIIAKQKAFVYIRRYTLSGDLAKADTYLEASFLAPDKRNQITISIINAPKKDISGSIEEKVFNTVISSFTFVR
ncbi:MAG TPA: hypothetical protein DD001_22040 [Microcoleaceae bacterium UBA10368]|jgi:hypothetical protein|nr:hypothetical protein [Microcoleaceae cyanobacterium UBA10368]HCV31308.1 hypothetical protein [Microcoleaceae cyanobacterium UBA9251]